MLLVLLNLVMAEETYKQLFHNSPVPMYIYDEKTFAFCAVNEAALRQYGYSEPDFLDMNAMNIRPAEDIAQFCAANVNVPERYMDFGRWRHIRKNGEIFYVHIYAHTTKFKRKRVRLVLAIDIDGKVKTESELEKKDQEIASILESTTDGFYALSRNWEVTYFNKKAEQVLGCAREEIIGKNLWDFFPESRAGSFYTEYERVMSHRVSVHFEEYYAPLGVWASMHVYPTHEGIVVYFVDITGQKRMQEKISNDKENLRAIINNTSDLIWSVDSNYDFISANSAFWKRLELKTGRQTLELLSDDFDKKTLEEWKGYYKRSFSGEAFRIVRCGTLGADLIFEDISFNPILDNSDMVVGVSCFARDITKQYQHIQMIEKQNEQLKQISWIQSHELRVPVANILGLVPLFNKVNLADPINLEVLSLMEQASIKLDGTIRKINQQTITIKDIDEGTTRKR
jgi:PAS domain S-box-containing protein